MATYSFLVNGELLNGGSSFPVVNPSTLAEVAACPNSSQEQVDKACTAAAEAKSAWAALSLEKRKEYLLKAAAILDEHADELGKLLVQEQGKPLKEAGKEGEVSWATALLRECVEKITLAPEQVNQTTKVYRRPLGVVCGITPWNFPIFCSVNKWAPALVLGNTFVHKPSPFTPLTGLKIGMLLKDVFPKGVFNVVTGDDKLAFNVGAHLSNHSQVNMVSFTGSVPTGKKIAEACTKVMRRFILEAGGNDAAIVLADADPKKAAAGLFAGAFNNSGQICCAVKRAYVHESIHEQVVEELVQCAKKAKFGDGFKDGVEYGPLNNKMQFDKVMGLIEDTKALPDAKIHCGGKKMAEGEGYFIEPTIISGVKEGTRIVDEEQFGPVLPVLKYSDEADAVKRANASDYGLGGSVWSSDVAKAAEVAGRLEAGTVWVNTHTDLTGGPFGGFKQSGMGREMGVAADLDSYSEKQSVFVNVN